MPNAVLASGLVLLFVAVLCFIDVAHSDFAVTIHFLSTQQLSLPSQKHQLQTFYFNFRTTTIIFGLGLAQVSC